MYSISGRGHLTRSGQIPLFTDTHWSISAHTQQLKETNFIIEEMIEVEDCKTVQQEKTVGSPWLIIVARKRD